MNLSIGEKRREVRRPAASIVRVRYFNPQLLEIRGRLIDVSQSGCRMAHDVTRSRRASGRVCPCRGRRQGAGDLETYTAGPVETGFFVVAISN